MMRKHLTVNKLKELGVLEQMLPCAVEQHGHILVFDGASECLLTFAERHWEPEMGARPWKPGPNVTVESFELDRHKGQSRGLGDTIKKISDATGITYVAELLERATGRRCGCSERQRRLNERFPYDAG